MRGHERVTPWKLVFVYLFTNFLMGDPFADAGWRSAVIYTIIQSCRRRGINPQEYLTDVLSRLPSMKNHEVKEVLPSRWKPSPARPA
jgi:hypothetical protein